MLREHGLLPQLRLGMACGTDGCAGSARHPRPERQGRYGPLMQLRHGVGDIQLREPDVSACLGSTGIVTE
jgi:hypothetical protein